MLYVINVYVNNLISVARSSAKTYEQLNVRTEHDACAPYATLGNNQQLNLKLRLILLSIFSSVLQYSV